LIVMGFFLLAVGRFVNRQIRESQRTEEGELGPGPFVLVNMEYWGLMLTIFGIIVVFIVPFRKVEARAATTPPARKIEKTNAPPKLVPKLVTNAPVVTPPPPPPPVKPVAFPKLKLQGIVFREPRPSALINGRTYFVGDEVQGAKVFSVALTNVVIEFQGQYKTLALDE
jgi:hypothetical protein